MIDNAGGSGAFIGYNEPDSAVVELTDIDFFGETEALECYDVPSGEDFDDQEDEDEDEDTLYKATMIKS